MGGRWWPGARRSRGGFAGGQVLLAASILSSCFLLSQGQSETTTAITVEPPTPQAGQSVSLKLETLPRTSLSCRWYRGAVDEGNRIFSYYFGTSVNLTGPAYTGRETVDSNCSLHITNLNSSDSRNYTVAVEGVPNIITGRVELKVLESVHNVIISGPSSARENQVITLTCLSAGTDVVYSWLKDNQLVQSGGNVVLNSNTLTFNTTTRNDSANYICIGNNTISTNSSEPHWLDIFYGPDEPLIEPLDGFYEEFGTLNLSCSANSNPPANYSWSHNGEPLEHEGTFRLVISPLSLSDGGNYICNATNDYTGLSSNASREISILEGVHNVSIIGPTSGIENQFINFTCFSEGTDVSYYWLKDNQLIQAGGNVFQENNVLIFNPATRDDSANYTCFVNNTFSLNSSEPHWLDVFYGPDEPIIEPNKTVYQQFETVNLSCSANSNPSANYSWYFNGQPLEHGNTSRLVIPSFSQSEAGNYTCRATNDYTGLENSTNLQLRTIENVTGVTITSDPVKVFEDSVAVLTCTSAGSDVSYFWLKGDQPLEAEGHISLSDNNRKLTFTPVNRNDSGNYTCYGNNSISNSSSVYKLDVLYGPDRPVISPDNLYYEKGSNLSLTCSADSNPPANYTWVFLESVHNGSILSLVNLSVNDSGTYTCEASNEETGLSNSTDLMIEVIEKLSPPILSPAKRAVVEKENVTLYCDISSSTDFNISWFKNNQPISTSVNISDYQKNLTLFDFTKSDAGIYTCVASNQISNGTSNPSEITLAYGPNITLKPSGVKNLKLGSKLDLQCTVHSNPAAQLRWFFNGTDQNVTTYTFIIHSVTSNDGGNYTCQATNDVTHIVAAASVIVMVSNEGGGLSSGAIAGIVIGCLAGVILIAGLIYFLYTRTSCGRMERHTSNGNISSAPGHNQGATDTKPRSVEEDIQYSTLAFKANSPPQPVPVPTQPSEGNTIYSEIKKK